MNNQLVSNKSFIFSLLAIFAILLVTNSAFAQQADEPYRLGVDYDLIDKPDIDQIVQFSELESISNIEIFYWYGCEACFQVEAAIEDYLANNSHLSLRRTPLVVRSSWREQAYLQAMMTQLSEAENLPSTMDIYRQCLTDCSVFSKFESTQKWLLSHLEDPSTVVIEQELVWQAEKNYRKRADLFLIRQVPTIIINETYKVDANQAGTSKRLVEIIDFLLTK